MGQLTVFALMTSGESVSSLKMGMRSMLRLLTITEQGGNMRTVENGMRPIHPGEVLREEFLVPMGITPHALALALHVPAPRINDIVRERRAITADTAMRLARFFNMSAEFWMGLQSDFEVALAKKSLATDLESIQPFKRLATA